MTLGSTARSKLEMSMKGPQNELQKDLQMQDLQIEELTSQIQEFEEQIDIMRQEKPRVGNLPNIEGDQQMSQDEQHEQYEPELQQQPHMEDEDEEIPSSPMKAAQAQRDDEIDQPPQPAEQVEPPKQPEPKEKETAKPDEGKKDEQH